MSAPSYLPIFTAGSYDPQQLLQYSKAGTTSFATTTLYSPPASQHGTLKVPRQQSQMVQPIYPQQHAMPSTHSSNPLIQGNGQSLYPLLQGKQVVEVVQCGPVTNQPQGVYNQIRPQPVMVSAVQTSQPSLQVPCTPAQCTSPTQLWVTQPGITNQKTFRAPHFFSKENIQDPLAGHEPCIQTLTFLEAQIEQQKHIEKTQSEQLRTMWEKSSQQEKKLEQLKVECRLKDLTIEDLESRIEPRKIGYAHKTEVPRLRAVIKEQRDELERLQRGTDTGFTDNETDRGKRCSRRSNKSLDTPVKRSSDDVSSQSETVESYQDELTRLRQENEAFRLVIGRLERENSEISKLRIEVLQLGIKLQEVKPLQHRAPNRTF